MTSTITSTRTGFRGPLAGRASYVEAPPTWRATTVQACGLWPFGAASGAPTIGTPIGRHADNGAAVCFDPISWFSRAQLISTPIEYILGKPGLGKSTFVRRQLIGQVAQGVTPLVLGDLRPDYATVVRAVGGQVLRLGRGLGSLNPLDVGALGQIIPQLDERAADQVRAEVHGRRLHMVASLVELVRGTRVTDHEETILSAAIRILDRRFEGHPAPLLHDLIALLDEGPEELQRYTLARGSDEAYRAAVDPLHLSLLATCDGAFGDVFSKPSTVHIDASATAVCIDVSALPLHDKRLTAAVLLASWNHGFGAIEASNKLADAGQGPQRRFFVIMDELWRVLRHGLVERLDEMTRINREWATACAYITHSSLDAETAERPEDRAAARGFIERAGAVVEFGLPRREVDDLGSIIAHSTAERRRLTEWSAPGAWNHDEGSPEPPPGQGKCLIKVGSRPGIPTQVLLTEAERRAGVHDTNRRWQE